MAGTRRQYRARDTSGTHQHRRSTSQIASFVPETAIATEPKVVEITDGVDGNSPRQASSPHPETPADRSTIAFCRKCNSKIGEFYNSWHKVTSSYYSPVLLGSYRSLLRRRGQRKEAADKSELKGCTIDLTHCPGCDDCLGFVVVNAPADARRFRDRDFFKLQRIELRCETSPNKTIIVEPQEDAAPDLVASGDSTSPSSRPGDTATETMELDTPLSSAHPLWAQPTHRELQHQQQRAGPGDPLGQPLQSNGAPPSAMIHPSQSPQSAQPRHASIVGSSTKDGRPDSLVNGHRNGYSYPRDPREVYFDAIERLQTQTAQNTSALAAQARSQTDYAEMLRQMEGSLRHEFQSQLHRQDQELRRMDDSVNRLHQELQDCRRTIATLAQEVNVTRAEGARRPSEMAQPGYQDEALELMAQRIGEVSHRTTDLEILRDHVAIMGGRVQRLESESAATHNLHSRPALPAYQPAQTTHITNAAPPHANHVSPFQAPPRSTSNPQPVPHHEKPAVAVPDSNQTYEPAPSQNGWTTANAGVKRVFENDTNSPRQGAHSAPGSPKRPRLVAGELQDAHSMPQITSVPSHILPSQTQPVVASQPQPQSGLQSGPHLGLPSSQAYTSYGTQDGPSDQSWRPESQRVAESRPARGRGSRGGRGPGSRGGRVRRSMQGQHRLVGTPEWERDSWTAVPDSQASPISFEDSPLYAARGTIRRGGGGSGMRGGSSFLERQNDWTPQIGPRSVFHEPPSETKKTRSKPVRNEEGILVRKDGRPDRRSQSSAANLRKVHARKEEQHREGEAGSTPNGLHHSMSAGPDTPSPTPHGQLELDITNSVRRRHNDILGKIFPDGIDSSRKQHDYAHQVFNEDRDHTAHPRAHSSRTAKNPPRIKKEHTERSEVAETQISTNGDVNMDDAASFADSHTQNSAHAAAGAPAGTQQRGGQTQDNPERESRMQIPETQAPERSAPAVVGLVEA